MSLLDVSPQDPYELFKAWYQEAAGICPDSASLGQRLMFWVKILIRKCVSKFYPPISMHQPDSMIVSSMAANGQPSSRVVLLKGISEEGLVFYTNYESRKGKELALNPNVSVLFHWGQPERQVRLEGAVEKIPYERSAKYWQSRPRGSQVSGYASPQSEEVPNRQWLVNMVKQVEQDYVGKDIPCPEFWGGYLIRPVRVEFWQGQLNRFHDRVVYKKTEQGWVKSLLAP